MKNSMVTAIFCVSFFSSTFAAESPEQFPFVSRRKSLGNAGDDGAKVPKSSSRINISPLPTKRSAFSDPVYISPRDKFMSDKYEAKLAPELSNPPKNSHEKK